jgi:hypothetical protein
MAVFHRDNVDSPWLPSDLARGPFAGLQGGAIAGLLTAEVERVTAKEGLGNPVHLTAWFLRPVLLAPLRTRTAILHAGGRVSIVDATLHSEGEEHPLAMVRVSIARLRPLELANVSPAEQSIDPTALPLRRTNAPHGKSWFMDTMEARQGERGTVWFKMLTPVVEGAGPLAAVAGPADWAHGIGRPLHDVVADPNSNLSVHLLRPPRSAWIGIAAHARWQPEQGTGVGSATLLDTEGEIGKVTMSVMLTPHPLKAPPT